jgi:hypothetical protein
LQGWPGNVILLISVSKVAKITSVNYNPPTVQCKFYCVHSKNVEGGIFTGFFPRVRIFLYSCVGRSLQVYSKNKWMMNFYDVGEFLNVCLQ